MISLQLLTIAPVKISVREDGILKGTFSNFDDAWEFYQKKDDFFTSIEFHRILLNGGIIEL